jgi:hypothetical protein
MYLTYTKKLTFGKSKFIIGQGGKRKYKINL